MSSCLLGIQGEKDSSDLQDERVSWGVSDRGIEINTVLRHKCSNRV